MDFSIIFIIIQLILLEGLLSIDNAAVLGTLVSKLPKDEPSRGPNPCGYRKKAAENPGQPARCRAESWACSAHTSAGR